MLMMLGRFGAWENAIAADAHDWGLGGAIKGGDGLVAA